MDSTGSKEIAQQPFERNEILRLYISFLAVHAPCPGVGKWSEFLEEINRLCLLQEEKPKGELKQFGPEDTQELIKSIRQDLDATIRAGSDKDGVIGIFGKKDASERIGFAHSAMLDAVYEGAAQWESDCKDAQSQISALRSENERLKGERDQQAKDFAEWVTKEEYKYDDEAGAWWDSKPNYDLNEYTTDELYTIFEEQNKSKQ